VVGRFPLYADADVRGPLIKALRRAGWDIVRAVDELPQGAEDLPHFERAVELGRVLVTNDEDQEAIGDVWYRAGRAFPGVVVWRQSVYDQMSYRELVEVFESLARQEDPFSTYPILRIWPSR
jgi:hypothetical protein